MSFDYGAPAERDLATSVKNIGASLQRPRPSATRLRACRHPKPSVLGLRSGMHASNSSEIQRLYEAADYPLRKCE